MREVSEKVSLFATWTLLPDPDMLSAHLALYSNRASSRTVHQWMQRIPSVLPCDFDWTQASSMPAYGHFAP